jgi:hypothetical protein
MRILSFALISVAILDGLVTIGLLLIWLRGIDGAVFRNFPIQTPVVIVLLNLIQLIIVVAAMFVSRYRVTSNEFTIISF